MQEILKKYIYVFLISMLPIVELRGAVPVGVASGLPFWPTYFVSVLGNMLPVPFILLLVKPVLLFFQKLKFTSKIATFFLEKGHKAGAKFGNAKYWALFVFVAIPMPGTGAWTGSLAASLLDLDKGKSMLAIFFGVLTAGIIMGIVSFGLLGAINIFA
ncbi:MAG: small multi-drug export protein [Oscillospiraceae bacterium]